MYLVHGVLHPVLAVLFFSNIYSVFGLRMPCLSPLMCGVVLRKKKGVQHLYRIAPVDCGIKLSCSGLILTVRKSRNIWSAKLRCAKKLKKNKSVTRASDSSPVVKKKGTAPPLLPDPWSRVRRSVLRLRYITHFR